MNIDELFERVHNRETFLAFVSALIQDREAAVEAERQRPTDPRVLGAVPDAGGWYNFTIEQYLEAAHRWAEDSGPDFDRGLPAEPSWKGFAAFLYCGKDYE